LGPKVATGETAGLDLRAGPSYVVAPPSKHPDTGARYRWKGAAPWETPPSPIPARLRVHFGNLGRDRNGVAEPVGELIPQGQRRASLLSLPVAEHLDRPQRRRAGE
ncbi:MAG: bifunctional DNA primase/polymerase, partial [Pseudomonadota bacterium]